jgi:hypothetical protein
MLANMTLDVNELTEVSRGHGGQCEQLVPALLRRVMSCPWILRLQHTNTTRYCVILTVKCVASICFVWFFSWRWGGGGVNGDCRRSHVVRKRQTDETMQIKLTILLQISRIDAVTSCAEDRKSRFQSFHRPRRHLGRVEV